MKTKEFRSMSVVRTLAIAFISGTIILAGCKKDDTDSGTSSTTFKVTDAVIDDASVTGAFVTISDIKLDGQSVQGFTKTTVDLNAYQNGSTKTIGNFQLSSKTYNSITFVLDYDMDATGNAPGCYVVATGGIKHKLQSTSNTITVAKSISLASNTSASIVADFDLRKMVIRQTGNASDMYNFATSSELEGSIRVVAENKTGILAGKLSDGVSGSGKVVAYAYKKGTYNRATEMQAQGASGIYFKNAVSSSIVNGSGDYQLHFLESGDYEIYYASYKDTNSDGEFELKGTLVVSSSSNVDFLNLVLAANATLTVNATVTSVLP